MTEKETSLNEEKKIVNLDPSSISRQNSMPQIIQSPKQHPPINPNLSAFDMINSFQLKNYLSSKHILFYYPTMKHVALQIISSCKDVVEGIIDWKYFKDGFPDLKIQQAYNLRWSDVVFLADLSDPKTIFEQYAIMSKLPRLLAKSVKVFVPYFPTATMEREESYGRVATAKTLARLLSSIPQCTGGPAQLIVYDIHTLQNQFYFSDNVLIRLETCIPLLLHSISLLKDISVAFPDDGAYKRFYRYFKNYKPIICTKTRGENDIRIIKIKEGNCKNKNIIIVDDLIQTGGTLIECAKVLRNSGAKSVSCYCTHGVFPNNSYKRFIKNGKDFGIIDTFYITDTIPKNVKLLNNKKPFKILSVSNTFVPVIHESDDIHKVEN